MSHVKDLLPTMSKPSQAPQTSIPGMEEGGKKSSKAISPEARKRVEAIFKTFTKHYGAQRMNAHWGNQGMEHEDVKQNAEELKRYWAYKLRDTGNRGLLYALENLPKAFPPTVDEFIEIARRAPEPYALKLDVMETAEEREARKATGREQFAALKAKLPYLRNPYPETQENEE